MALAGFVALVAYSGVTAARMGREFMPELEEGTLLVRGTLPVNASLDETVARARLFRKMMQQFPEVRFIPTSRSGPRKSGRSTPPAGGSGPSRNSSATSRRRSTPTSQGSISTFPR